MSNKALYDSLNKSLSRIYESADHPLFGRGNEEPRITEALRKL